MGANFITTGRDDYSRVIFRICAMTNSKDTSRSSFSGTINGDFLLELLTDLKTHNAIIMRTVCHDFSSLLFFIVLISNVLGERKIILDSCLH